MKKIKKYQPGATGLYANTGGWNYGFGGSSGMSNPGNSTLPQYKTTSSSTIPTGSLPTSDDISQLTKSGTGAAGGALSGLGGMDIGGMASQLGTGIAMMINANKKDPHPERPYKNGTNMIKSKKNKLIKYQAGVTATDIIGPAGRVPGFEGEMSAKEKKDFSDYLSKKDVDAAIQRVNAMGTPVSPIAPRMASLNIPQQAPMSVRPNPVPTQQMSRRERKMENLRNERLLNKQDVEYMTPRTPTLGGNIPDRKPLIKMVDQQPVTAKAPKMFDYNSAEAKGGYARALKGGKRDAKGNLIDMETGLIYKDTRGKKANTPTPQPTPQKNVLSSQTIQDRGIAAQSDNTRVNVNVPSFRKAKQNNTSNYQDNSQIFKGTGHFQDGTKSVAKKVTKQDYLDAAAKMTPEQRRQFHELDAKGVKFKFGDLEYSGLQKGKGGGKTATNPANTGKSNGTTQTPTPQTPPKNTVKNTLAPQIEGGGQYSNVDWSGKSGFEWRNPLESIARPLVRIGVGASSKGLRGVGAGLVGELANVVADYTPKGTVNSLANNIQTMADAYNVYRGATNSAIDFKNMKPKQALEYLKNLWKNKVQMTGKPLPQMGKLGKASAETTQLNLPI